jgi:hypothetical protein
MARKKSKKKNNAKSKQIGLVQSIKASVYNPRKKMHQTGKSNIKKDSKRTAKAPGKRISKNGNIYYEYRKNRSDMPKKKV